MKDKPEEFVPIMSFSDAETAHDVAMALYQEASANWTRSHEQYEHGQYALAAGYSKRATHYFQLATVAEIERNHLREQDAL